MPSQISDNKHQYYKLLDLDKMGEGGGGHICHLFPSKVDWRRSPCNIGLKHSQQDLQTFYDSFADARCYRIK